MAKVFFIRALGQPAVKPEHFWLCPLSSALGHKQTPREQLMLTHCSSPCLGYSQTRSGWHRKAAGTTTRSAAPGHRAEAAECLNFNSHLRRDLPCTAASDARSSSCLLVIYRAQFKLLLCSSVRLLIYGEERFCSPCSSFPKRSTSAADVKSAKQSRVIDVLLLLWKRPEQGRGSSTAQKKCYHRAAG